MYIRDRVKKKNQDHCTAGNNIQQIITVEYITSVVYRVEYEFSINIAGLPPSNAI